MVTKEQLDAMTLVEALLTLGFTHAPAASGGKRVFGRGGSEIFAGTDDEIRAWILAGCPSSTNGGAS